jgi:hypothetical protein
MKSPVWITALLCSFAAAVTINVPALAAPLVPMNLSIVSTTAQVAPFVLKAQFSIEISPDILRPQEDDDDDYGGGNDNEDDNAGNGGGSHEEWCRRKYRSYRSSTDTWTDYDGNTRECISPY